MDELNAALDSLLRDPQQMAAIQKLAGELFGGQGGAEVPGAGGATDGGGRPHGAAPTEQSTGVGALSGLLSGSGLPPSGKAALVKALAPYLSPARGAKLQKALRLAQAVRLAATAWERLGGEGGV